MFLGSAIFDFDTLYRQGIQATWFNLYRSQNVVNPGFGSLNGPEYAGRIQVSGSVARSSDLNASVIPFDTTTINEPNSEEMVIFVDIYELDFMDECVRPENIPPEVWLQVQFGPNGFESERIRKCGMTCVFGEKIGRFMPIRIHLPVDRSMAFDMIISIYGQREGEERERMCFARLPVDRFMVTSSAGGVVPQVDPEWLRMTTIKNGTDRSGAGIVGQVSDAIVGGFESLSSAAMSAFGFGKPSFHRAGSSSSPVLNGTAGVEDSTVSVANILATIIAVKTSASGTADMIVKRQPPRIVYEMKPYELRFSVHQACNLPIAFSRSLTSAFCRVTVAGVSTRTSTIPVTLYPTWNELLRIKVDLPTNTSIRPEVHIEVLHAFKAVPGGTPAAAGAAPDEEEIVVLGGTSMKTSNLKPTQASPPSWYKLRNQSLGIQRDSYILCSAVLVPMEDIHKYPLPSPIPARATFTTDLLIIGVRLLRNFSIDNLNKIEVSWGRRKGNLKRKVVSVKTGKPVAGEGGQFNFLQPAMLDIDLPIDSLFQEFLEVRLLEQVEVDSYGRAKPKRAADTFWGSLADLSAIEDNEDDVPHGGSEKKQFGDRPIGYGYIHLNPHYSWLSEAERKQLRNMFKMKTHEEIRREEEMRSLKTAKQEQDKFGDSNMTRKKRRRELANLKNIEKDILEMMYIENEIDGMYGSSATDSNFVSLPIQYFNAVETDALFPDKFRRGALGRGGNGASKNDDDFFKNLRADRANEMVNVNQKFITDFVWEPTLSKDNTEISRKTIDNDIETELLDLESTLPYVSVPIVIGSTSGSESFTVVGYLKVKVNVREKSDDASELLSLQQKFTFDFDQCNRLMCRIYALRAEGIVPAGTSGSNSQNSGGSIAQNSQTSYFLWIRNISGDLIAEYPNCSIKDDGALTVEGGVNPEFNKCFQLPCMFPNNSLLHVELYERTTSLVSGGLEVTGLANLIGSSTDTLVGTLVVDLENRWFCPQYRNLLGGGIKASSGKTEIPIETLTLRSADSSGIPKGKLKLWVELMDQVTAMGRPIEILPSPQPEEMEVRIALWRTKGVPNLEGEDQTNQGVEVFMQGLDSQSTDTHYGSLDGTGTFNWRFVFNPTVPTEDGSIRFQVHHRPIVGLRNTPIGEVTIDISHELAVVRRTRRSINLPICWVPLSHPAFVGKHRGSIEIAIRVMTCEEARSFPVGKGRDSPNQDPYLDPDDIHLVQHRSILSNTAFGRSLAKFVEALQRGFRLATILFIIGWIIAGIVGLVILLISLGIIRF